MRKLVMRWCAQLRSGFPIRGDLWRWRALHGGGTVLRRSVTRVIIFLIFIVRVIFGTWFACSTTAPKKPT